jgi:PAS domain S-box-containing protein
VPAPSKEPEQRTESRVPDFRTLLNALPGPCLILRPDDPVFTVAAVNQAWCDAMLTSASDIVGRSISELFPDNPDDRNAPGVRRLRDSLRHVLATGTAHTMAPQKFDVRGNRHYPGSSEDRYWSPVNSPLSVNDGNVEFLIHRLEDMTELVKLRRLARADDSAQPGAERLLRGRQPEDSRPPARERREMEERLLAIEARYSLAFAQAPIGMVLLDPYGKILEINQAFADSLGYTRDELIGRDSSPWTHPDDVEITKKFFTSLRTANGPTPSIEKRYFRKDGGILWARGSATMRRDDLGNPIEVIAMVEDITERKYAEQQLWESQAHLRAVYDSTYEYTGLIALDGTVLNCNRASLEFAGNTLADVVGRPFWDIPLFSGTPGASIAVRAAVASAATGQIVRFETSLRCPSGSWLTFDFSLHPVRNEKGEVVFLVPEGRDITERNRAARQIDEDRGRWRELLRQTPAAIALLRGPDHVFDWVNPVYETFVGRSAATLLGRPVSEAVPEARNKHCSDLLNGTYRTGEPVVGHESPVSLFRDDGTARHLYINFAYLPTRDAEGRIDGIFVYVADVTGAVLARKQIEDSERQFRTLAESIPHLAWMADETGSRLWYNRRWYDYTGTSFDEVQGWGWQKTLDPAFLPEVLKRWGEALSSGESMQMVYPVRGADGTFRSFLTRVEPVRDIEGRIVRWFGTYTDITDQRNTEQELRRMNRELEEFAYVASHDLQEPLRMVNIYAEKILRDPGAAKEKLDQYSAFVKEGVKRMEALIDDLLAFSRSVHIEDAPCGAADLSAALSDAMSALKDRIAESGATIEAPPMPFVRGETSQLSHVFQNVLSNAIKYRKKDISPVIEIEAQREGRQWIVSIRDNGIGFESQYASRIFGLFKRLHKDEYPGTGLGLAICKRIVERYGGHMWAEGNPGVGAAIYFAIDAAEEE